MSLPHTLYCDNDVKPVNLYNTMLAQITWKFAPAIWQPCSVLFV